ncbi:MAG: CBS domain-containing protein [Trueperaceae bacterium]|nr:CBS domain-containing protein [Trueperaceae bacterium]
MLVREFMHSEPVTISPDTPLLEAEWRMQEGGFRHLPIVDGDDRLVGIVSDRDLREAAPSDATVLSRQELTYLLSRLKVKDVMTKPVLTARPAEPAEAAAIRMRENKVGALPVVDDERLVGIVTTADMLDALVRALQAQRTASKASRD